MANESLYLSDFMTGLLAALALKSIPSLSLRESRFDLAVEQVTKDLTDEARTLNLNVRFRIKTDPSHGDSSALQQALYEAARRDLISLDNPEFQDLRLKIKASDAPRYLEGLPGPKEMYERLADKLIEYYRASA
jgi:hypothetical protein